MPRPANPFLAHVSTDHAPTKTSGEPEKLGTVAEVSWSTNDDDGVETTTDLEVDVSYNIVDCSGSTCLELSELKVTTSDVIVEGISIRDPTVSLISVGARPVVNGKGNFAFPEGSLEVMVDYVAGGGRVYLTGTNTATTTGRVIPGSNRLSLNNLDFTYADVMITGTLSIDIVGDYVERAPVASFVPVSQPASCAQPVVFDATSTDADGDTLAHSWQVDDGTVLTGSSMSVVLSPGTYAITLLSIDDAGRADVEVVDYTRRCS